MAVRTPAKDTEARFVVAYLKSLDATRAASEIGYTAKHARQAGWRLLHRPSVREAIEREQAKQVQRIGMDAERIKQEIYDLATLDPGECFDAAGMPIPVKQLPPRVRACIKSVGVEVTPSGSVRTVIHFWDKPKALHLAAQHLKLLAPTEVTVNHRFQHAHLSDAELQQKLLDAAQSLG